MEGQGGYRAPGTVLPFLMWLDGWAAAGKRVRETHREGYEHMALAEVEDAMAVYAEMNAFGELLRGEPLNLEVPPSQSDAALWSGRRLVDRAVVRTFKQGGGEAPVQVEAWPGHPVTLPADGIGRTYRLRLELMGVQVEATPAR